MIQFQLVLQELLGRLRASRVAAYLPCQGPPAAPPPPGPRSPRPPQKPPIRLPPLPPASPPPLPMPVPSAQAATVHYPRLTTTWGLDGGFKPTTSGYETRVFEPPRTTPKVADNEARPFSIFDDLWDDAR